MNSGKSLTSIFAVNASLHMGDVFQIRKYVVQKAEIHIHNMYIRTFFCTDNLFLLL